METYPQPKKRSRLKIVFISLASLFLLGLLAFGLLSFYGYKNAHAITASVKSFLQATSNGNLDGAYALTTQNLHDTISRAEFTKTIDDSKAQFTDFERIETIHYKDSIVHDGHVYFGLIGTVTYTDGHQGELSAILLKEDGEWRVAGIEVDVSPARLEKFQE